MEKHYVYGGGMVGCLYDYGPNFSESKQDAIDSMVELYLGSVWEVSWDVDAVEADMRAELESDGIYYFPSHIRCDVGADYCDVSEESGPMPEGEE